LITPHVCIPVVLEIMRRSEVVIDITGSVRVFDVGVTPGNDEFPRIGD
jgi:hypothetical protein